MRDWRQHQNAPPGDRPLLRTKAVRISLSDGKVVQLNHDIAGNCDRLETHGEEWQNYGWQISYFQTSQSVKDSGEMESRKGRQDDKVTSESESWQNGNMAIWKRGNAARLHRQVPKPDCQKGQNAISDCPGPTLATLARQAILRVAVKPMCPTYVFHAFYDRKVPKCHPCVPECHPGDGERTRCCKRRLPSGRKGRSMPSEDAWLRIFPYCLFVFSRSTLY